MGRTLLIALVITAFPTLLCAQGAPIVKMSVTMPDGRVTQVTAPESGLAELTLPDQTRIGLIPTLIDDKPWTKAVVTLFRMPTASEGVQDMGAIEVRKGGPAVPFKLSPAVKVTVTEVTEADRASTTPTTR
jgi:hypothetical protein